MGNVLCKYEKFTDLFSFFTIKEHELSRDVNISFDARCNKFLNQMGLQPWICKIRGA